MTIYEVTAIVESDYTDAYESYIRERHVKDVLTTGFFVSATFERSEPGRYRVRYVLPSREYLDSYLGEHAPRLRAEFHEEFPIGVELSREVWDVLEAFA